MTDHLHQVQRPGQRITTYVAPRSIGDALAALGRYGPRARPVAGGTDLLVELDRGARPGVDVLVDLSRIPGLDTIDVGDETIRLGPLTTHNDVVASAACRRWVTPLAQACLEVGAPALRNRATVVGNVVTASPANDTLSALVALGASVELRSATGTRTMPVADFVIGFRATALEPGELVTAVLVPRLGPTERGVFVKLGLRRAQAISVLHLAAVVDLADPDAGPDASVVEARLAIGSAGPTIVTVPTDALIGRPLDRAAIAEIAAAATAAIRPIDDVRATAAYRTDLVAVMVRRGLESLAAGTHLDRFPPRPPLLRAVDAGPRPAHRRDGDPTTAGIDDGIDDGAGITVMVDGRSRTGADAASATLLDWLRAAGATGVKEGCAEGECGACTVVLDGAAVLSCLVPAGRAAGSTVTTAEGLASDPGTLHPVQAAFVTHDAVQCGFCTPGFVVAAACLLDEFGDPSPDQVTAGLAGNLCRCTGYRSIHDAVTAAAGSGHR